VFDEGTDFLESQYRFIIGWNRSTDPNQRCRVLVTSNQIKPRIEEILGSDSGYNGQLQRWKLKDRQIDIAANDSGWFMGCEVLGTPAGQKSPEPCQPRRATLVHDNQRRRSGG
jgi:hypothetical protein